MIDRHFLAVDRLTCRVIQDFQIISADCIVGNIWRGRTMSMSRHESIAKRNPGVRLLIKPLQCIKFCNFCSVDRRARSSLRPAKPQGKWPPRPPSLDRTEIGLCRIYSTARENAVIASRSINIEYQLQLEGLSLTHQNPLPCLDIFS